MENLPRDKKIVLFDGVCNLCDNSVQFIIKNDPKDLFRFASIQSEIGQQIITYLGIDASKVDSIILYVPGEAYYIKAEAAMQIAKNLNSWHRFLALFSFTGSFGNFIYDYVAKNRYQWYGKKEECMIPTEEMKAKFL
ncbi:thiol-disulfide oxidoreductase DCC family protein [Flavobacterium orientale]|uniref:Thiol-disulfide oxidoreductase n=1 Tax=Flavobacterium orientale TaxID=1756020 RepID=A0A917DBU3_9FLAO|nr:DCC1-like thiol-disulfide oxidoreductase family protein [Flavobacterium orientale]GGD24625.1 thiol-disulfide oxidoreductase [Flavobacterium orientale]